MLRRSSTGQADRARLLWQDGLQSTRPSLCRRPNRLALIGRCEIAKTNFFGLFEFVMVSVNAAGVFVYNRQHIYKRYHDRV